MRALEEFDQMTGVNYVITNDVNQATFRLSTTITSDYGAYFFPQDPAYGAEQGMASSTSPAASGRSPAAWTKAVTPLP